ncbi:MAG TPA: hypothetical protein VKU94_06345 [Geobacterales bacterium]|nr:hypothetical protein [Geobacterales bacterium]
MNDIMHRLEILQSTISHQLRIPVDLYYMEGYGALAVPRGYQFHPSNVVFAFPDIAITVWS